MRVGALYCLALCAACGRIGFDDGTEGGGSGGSDDLSSVRSLSSVATLEIGAHVQRLVPEGTLLYAATTRTTNPLVVLDISNPMSPVEVGNASTDGVPNDIAISGDLMYVVTDAGGDDLEVFDVSTRTAPVKLGGIATADSALRVAVAGDRAYVTSAAAGDDLEIFDITDPSAPVKLGGIDLLQSYYARGVAVAYPLVYVATSKMSVIDVSTPATPSTIGEGRFYWYAWDLALEGTRVIGLDSNNGNEPQLRVWDTSTPSAPTVVGMAEIWDSYGRDVAVVGNTAYTVCAPGGYSYGAELEVWDISGSPVRTAHAHLDTDGLAVAVVGDYAYVGRMESASDREIEVIDIR